MYRLAGIDNATCFIALGNTGRSFLKRAAIMSPTNSGNYQYTKFTTYVSLNITHTLDGDILKNSGSPKIGNDYGDRVSVLARKITGEGRQQIHSNKE